MDRTVQVSPLPTGISKQSLEDKLMIHFLRSKNGGGEIIDILFAPDSPTFALIIFEEAEVAQRVLGVENHVLEINGEHHKLKVESACTEIKVDQVILHVSMTINYGKLLGGRKLMRHFQKMHRDIQFSFDQKAEQCNVAGTFAAIQQLSGAIHQLLNLNPSQTNSDSNEAEQHHREGLQNSVPGRSSSFRKVEQKSNADSSAKGERLELQTKTRVQGFAQSGVGRDTDLQKGCERQTRNFEDYTLLMDSDIYGYIQKFYKDGYQDILHQHLVKVVDFTSEDITTLILQEASDCPDSKVSLPQAHQELSKLYQDFEFRLRKEQISKKDITSDISVLQNIYASLQIQFPKINFNENENYFYLIGTSDDCSLAKKCLEDLKKEVAGRTRKGKHPASSRDSESRRARDSHIPQPLRDGNEHSEQIGVSKADSKKDHKLAPTFSGLGGKVSPLKAGSRLAEGDLILKPEQAHTASSFFTGYRMETNPQDVKYLLYSEMQQKPRHCMTDSEMFTSAGEALTSGTEESVVPRKTEEDSFLKTYKDFSVFSGQSKDLKSPDKTDDDILFKGHEGSSIVGTNKVDKLFQYVKGNKTHGPIKPYHFETSAGTLFHQGDLLSDTHTLQSLTTTTGSEGHTFKPSLRRTNSFSEYSKSKYSRDFSDSFQGVPKVNPVEQVHITEEIPMESVVWSYLKDIYDSSIRNIGAKTDVMMNEQIQGDITIIKLTALNKANITAAKQDILSLYTMVMKHLVQQFISFTDLGIEDHKVVERWSIDLKKMFPEVKFIIAQTGFKIVATYEHCMKVIELLKPKLKDPVSSTDLGSISAPDPCSFTGTDTFTGTEGKDLRRFTERSSFLDQSPQGGKKPNGFHTPAHHVDETSPRESAKTREEHPLFQTDQELIEATAHRKVAGSPKTNWNSQPDVEEEENQKNKKTYSNENSGPASNSRQEHSPLMDQKKSPKPFDEYSQFGFLHDQADYKSQKMSKQIGDGEGVKAKKALPDKFNFNANRVGKESHWYNREDSLHCNKLDSGTQSLPLFSYTGALVPQQNRDGPHASESATNSGDQTQEQYMQQQEEGSLTTSQEKKTMRNSQQNQPRSPAIGLDAEELNRSASSCASCKKNGRLLKLDCGHSLCKECRTHSQPLCPACDQPIPSIRNENQSMGTMVWTSVNNNSVGGKEMMLKITYKILDGIQQECDPNPGQPFTGGLFTAYLPDNRTGYKILNLLVDAFNRGLTFKIVSFPSGSGKVTWNDIPHKTKITGGRCQHGYPDSSYLKNVLAALEKHGLQ